MPVVAGRVHALSESTRKNSSGVRGEGAAKRSPRKSVRRLDGRWWCHWKAANAPRWRRSKFAPSWSPNSFDTGRRFAGSPMNQGASVAAFPVARSDDHPPRAAHLHVAHQAQRSVPTDVEQNRLVERAAFAATLDRELRRLCLAEAAARRVFGVVAHELLRRRAYGRLGFARLTDYAAERIGCGSRAATTRRPRSRAR
jgi:hypothetical protein